MNIKEILEKLHHPDNKIKHEAYVRILSSFDASLLEPLKTLATPLNQDMEILYARFLQNMSIAISMPEIMKLLESPNQGTRASALNTLSQIDINNRLKEMLLLLKSSYSDVVLYIIDDFAKNKKEMAIYDLSKLLGHPDDKISLESFKALARIDIPRCVPLLVSHLKSYNPAHVIRALSALGQMKSFNRWKLFIPLLTSDEKDIRKNAVINIQRIGQDKAEKYILSMLDNETEPEIIKTAITCMTEHPSKKLAEYCICQASSHSDHGVRRTAGWALEEIKSDDLMDAMRKVFDERDDNTRSYILSKMGHRQLDGVGKFLVGFLNDDTPHKLRIAAIEGLGFSGDIKYLDYVTRFLSSTDDITAYIATLSTCNLTGSLKTCQQLIEILQTPTRGNIAQRQVILQYMLTSISFDLSDKTLRSIILNNLNDSNINIRYHSVLILASIKDLDVLPHIIKVFMDDQDSNVRNASLETINRILAGKISLILSLKPHIKLLFELNWNKDDVFNILKYIDGLVDELYEDSLRQFAKKSIRVNPEHVHQFIFELSKFDKWSCVLAKEILKSFKEPLSKIEKELWLKILNIRDGELLNDVLESAINLQATWTVPYILKEITWNRDQMIVSSMRDAVRKIMRI